MINVDHTNHLQYMLTLHICVIYQQYIFRQSCHISTIDFHIIMAYINKMDTGTEKVIVMNVHCSSSKSFCNTLASSYAVDRW
jgi:hypothetical protein